MAATSFSYAQAARGQLTSHTSKPTAASQSEMVPVPTTHPKDDETNEGGAQAAAFPASPTTVDSSKPPARLRNADLHSPTSKVTQDVVASPAVSSTLVGTLAESASSFSLDESTTLQPTPNDKNGRMSSQGTRSPSSEEAARKGGCKSNTRPLSSRDGGRSERSEESDKEKERATIELAPAPLPIINVWSQRMIQQAAKLKQTSSAPASAEAVTLPAAPTPTIIASGDTATEKDAKRSSTTANDGQPSSESFNPPANSSKIQQKRPADNAKSSNELSRRNVPRGSRISEKQEGYTSTPGHDPLSLVQDDTSWPTPVSAAVVDDARPKVPSERAETATEKDLQDESAPSKFRKKGWLPLPFVPTVNFQTPIPNVRGYKSKTGGGRGGRESSARGGYNGTANGNSTSDRLSLQTLSSTGKAPPEPRDGSKDVRSISFPTRQVTALPGSSKRLPIDSSYNHREPRKSSAPTALDRPKEPALTEYAGVVERPDPVPKNRSAVANSESSATQQQSLHPTQSECRIVPPMKNTDQHTSLGKENGTCQANDQHTQGPRERAETRNERSNRGGFRGGRGGHGGGSSQNHHLSHSSFSAYQPNGQRVTSNAAYSNGGATTLPPNATPFSPPPQQFALGSAVRPTARNVSRAQSTSQSLTGYGTRPQNGNPNPVRLMNPAPSHASASLQSDFQMQPLPFQAYGPYMDAELLHGLTLQVEYYFSVDNLCKDVFLRRKMNDQGFVPLLVVAKFKRMAELAPSLDFIRAACEQSENLDYILDQESSEWIRSRFFWGNFVLPVGERDEEARKPSPDLRTVIFRSTHSRTPQSYVPAIMAGAYSSVSQPMVPGVYPTTGNEVAYSGYTNWAPDSVVAPNGSTAVNGHLHRGESQLSAAVPDFSPGGTSGAPMTLEDYQTYPDEQVDKLVVLLAFSDADNLTATDSTDQPHFTGQGHSQAGQSMCGELKMPTTANGGAQQKAGAQEAPYPALRSRAFEQRKSAKSGDTPADMKHLYRFWSHCLMEKFNVRMYEEFRTAALEDAQCSVPNDYGLKYLIRYYNGVLAGSAGARPYPAVFKPHSEAAKKLSDSLRTKANGEQRV